jgi:D-alanyl-D-alanine-carboxypeptidase/D-alanyl-D-alanine-endopeptidase
MLTFLEAFLGYKESPLAPAMKAMLEVRRPVGQTEMGLAWFLNLADGKEIALHDGGTGGFRSFVGYDAKERIGVVVLSNGTRSGVEDIGLHLLNPKFPLTNPEPPKQRTEIPIDPKLLDNYTGRYQVTPNLIFEITRDGDRLFAQAFAQTTGQPSSCLSLNCLPKARRTSLPGWLTTRSPLKLAPRAELRGLFCTEPVRPVPPPPDYPDSRPLRSARRR